MLIVIGGLVVSMTVGILVTYAMMPPPRQARSRPAHHIDEIFPDRMASLRPGRWQYIVIHDSGAADLQALTADGTLPGGHPAGFHFLVGNGAGLGDGEVRATERWIGQRAGQHTRSGRARSEHAETVDGGEYDRNGIGICLVGDLEHTPPSDAQLDVLVLVVDRLMKELSIRPRNVYLHSELEQVTCPGDRFPTAMFYRRLAEKSRNGLM